MTETITLAVNGAERQVDLAPGVSLLNVLREQLGLTGAKIGCGEGACGSCTVLLDGEPVRSCVTPARDAAGRQVRTIEGLAAGDRLHPLQQAIIDADAFQCGYCTPGMIMAGVALLERDPHPDEAAITAHMQGNLCRCGMYARIVDAIRAAGGER